MTVKQRLLEIAETFSEEELRPFSDKIVRLQEGLKESRCANNGSAESWDQKRDRILALKGILKGSRPNLGDFLREKQEELDQEEQRFGRI
jgi:hypothetical protein